MKIRKDFVTNSSSSSFIIASKVIVDDELKDYLKEEYGNYGLKLLDFLYDYKDLDEYQKETIDENSEKIDENGKYLFSRFYTWSTEGDENGGDAFLYNILPEKNKIKIFETEDC